MTTRWDQITVVAAYDLPGGGSFEVWCEMCDHLVLDTPRSVPFSTIAKAADDHHCQEEAR